MRRTTLVTVSIAGHFALGLGLYASGIWKIERLESDHRLAGIGVMTPTQAAGGSPDLPAPKFQKKETEKKIVKNTQPAKHHEEDKPTTQVSTTSGTGNGGGGGITDGPEIGGPPGDPCTTPDCAPPVVETPKPSEPPKQLEVHTIAPNIMSALRIQGDTQIHPSNNVKNQILSDGKTKVVGTLKVCIQATGAIGSVAVIGSTKYPEYDQTLVEAVRRWQYRPFTVNGTPHPACSAVSFVYSIK